MPIYENVESLVTGLYDRDFLKFGEPGQFELNSTRQSCIYFKPDGIASFGDGLVVHDQPVSVRRQREVLGMAIDGLSQTVDTLPRPHDHIFGMPQALTALGMAVARHKDESYIWQRADDGKSHGVRKVIAGDYIRGDTAVALDNALTTGGEFLRTSIRIHKQGLRLIGLAVLFDRQEGGREAVRAVKHDVASVFTLHDALEILFINKRIGTRELENVDAEHRALAARNIGTTLGFIL
jgi:orotate phosphoribosyltransferase